MYAVLPVFVSAMFVVVGSVGTVSSILDERSARAFDRRASQAVGVVTNMRDVWVSSHSSDMHSNRHSSGHWEHFPVVAFRALDGSDVQTVTKDDVRPRDYPPGRSLTVRYDPEDPTVAHVCERHASLGKAAFGVLFSLVFVVVGAVMLVHHFAS